jgi:hypothetical protein
MSFQKIFHPPIVKPNRKTKKKKSVLLSHTITQSIISNFAFTIPCTSPRTNVRGLLIQKNSTSLFLLPVGCPACLRQAGFSKEQYKTATTKIIIPNPHLRRGDSPYSSNLKPFTSTHFPLRLNFCVKQRYISKKTERLLQQVLNRQTRLA